MSVLVKMTDKLIIESFKLGERAFMKGIRYAYADSKFNEFLKKNLITDLNQSITLGNSWMQGFQEMKTNDHTEGCTAYTDNNPFSSGCVCNEVIAGELTL